MDDLANWKFIKLKQVSKKFISGGTPSTKIDSFWNGKIPWMTSAHITKKTVNKGMRYITKEGLMNSSAKIVPKESILVATRVGIGKVAVNRIDIAISQDLTGVVIDHTKLDAVFAYWILSNFASRLKSISQGSTIKGLLRKEIENLKIPLPPLAEQKKIAEVLSTVGEAIEKIDEAIEKTQRLKKGLMQQILTRGIGHKEFRETEIGRIPKEWEVVRLEDISFNLIGGGTPSTSNSNYWNGHIAWMTSAHIERREITEGQRYITDEGLKSSATSLIPKDNILIATRVSIGKVAINRIDIAISQDLTGIIIDKNKSRSDYLYWAILSNQNKLKALSQGSTIPGILRSELSKMKLALPSLVEQQIIAEFLSTVDRKLDILRERKTRLERVKKGLMNDLLTGRKRVKLDS
jgi:type I restriction enzyme S subunit